MPINLLVLAGASGVSEAGGVLSKVVTQEMMSGVLDEIIGVLPVCLPVMITFIGIRKGISFVTGVLRAA